MPRSDPMAEGGLGFADIGGEDAGGEALGHGIVQLDGLDQLAILHRIEDGREGLLADDLALPRHLDDGGMDVMRLGKAIGQSAAAAVDLAAIGLGALQRPGHGFEGRAIDERSDQHALGQWIADGHPR